MFDSILSGCAACTQEPLDERTTIKSFRIIKESTSDGTVIAMPTADIAVCEQLGNAVARLDLETPFGPVSGILIDQDDAPVTDRIDSYNSEDYVARMNRDDSGASAVALENIQTRVDLMRGIIEGMRQTEWASPNADSFAEMRWGYITNFPLVADAACADVSSIQLSAPRYIDNGQTVFSIRTVDIPHAGFGDEVTMCFYIGLKS